MFRTEISFTDFVEFI